MLPRRLAPVLPSPYSLSFLHLVKAHAVHAHLGFPRHAYAHCEGFATAALRRAWTFVSVSISRLPLSRPVRIKATVGRYPTVKLIHRRLILRRWTEYRSSHFSDRHSSACRLWVIVLSFPRLSPSLNQIVHVLLSWLPGP